MEESMSTFQSVVEAEQRNGGPKKTTPGRKGKPFQQIKPRTGDG